MGGEVNPTRRVHNCTDSRYSIAYVSVRSSSGSPLPDQLARVEIVPEHGTNVPHVTLFGNDGQETSVVVPNAGEFVSRYQSMPLNSIAEVNLEASCRPEFVVQAEDFYLNIEGFPQFVRAIADIYPRYLGTGGGLVLGMRPDPNSIHRLRLGATYQEYADDRDQVSRGLRLDVGNETRTSSFVDTSTLSPAVRFDSHGQVHFNLDTQIRHGIALHLGPMSVVPYFSQASTLVRDRDTGPQIYLGFGLELVAVGREGRPRNTPSSHWMQAAFGFISQAALARDVADTFGVAPIREQGLPYVLLGVDLLGNEFPTAAHYDEASRGSSSVVNVLVNSSAIAAGAVFTIVGLRNNNFGMYHAGGSLAGNGLASLPQAWWSYRTDRTEANVSRIVVGGVMTLVGGILFAAALSSQSADLTPADVSAPVGAVSGGRRSTPTSQSSGLSGPLMGASLAFNGLAIALPPIIFW